MTTINSGRWSKKEHNQLLTSILGKNISDIDDKIDNFIKNGTPFPNYINICKKIINYQVYLKSPIKTRTKTQIRTHMQKVKNKLKKALETIDKMTYQKIIRYNKPKPNIIIPRRQTPLKTQLEINAIITLSNLKYLG